ncbi:MAG: hypothetical protein HYU64_14725 [Armatimonadetes bacterium]|nr:hypothetical protein [Armatimonadota bacterium]
MRIVLLTRLNRGLPLLFLEEMQSDSSATLCGVVYERNVPSRGLRFFARKLIRYCRMGAPLTFILNGLSFLWRSLEFPPAHRQQEPSLRAYCVERGILFLEVDAINGEQCRKILRDLAPDLMVSAGNRLLKRSVFAIPPLGTINLHTGKVPDYRGGPPFFWELYHGEETVGATVHFVDDGVDTGPIIATGEFPILPGDTVNSLKERIIPEGARLLREAIHRLTLQGFSPVFQPACHEPPRRMPSDWQCLRFFLKRLGRRKKQGRQ